MLFIDQPVQVGYSCMDYSVTIFTQRDLRQMLTRICYQTIL